MSGCYALCWGESARVLSIVLDLAEFGCVLALMVLTAVFLTDFQLGVCYLDGARGFEEATVCQAVFWAAIAAGVLSFLVAVSQLCMCCLVCVVVFLELAGNAALGAWWLALGVYVEFYASEANRLGLPYQPQRSAAIALPFAIASLHALSGVLALGKMATLMCCSPPPPRHSYPPPPPEAQPTPSAGKAPV